eukprot:4957771-Amphidinium_carterae.1
MTIRSDLSSCLPPGDVLSPLLDSIQVVWVSGKLRMPGGRCLCAGYCRTLAVLQCMSAIDLWLALAAAVMTSNHCGCDVALGQLRRPRQTNSTQSLLRYLEDLVEVLVVRVLCSVFDVLACRARGAMYLWCSLVELEVRCACGARLWCSRYKVLEVLACGARGVDVDVEELTVPTRSAADCSNKVPGQGCERSATRVNGKVTRDREREIQ